MPSWLLLPRWIRDLLRLPNGEVFRKCRGFVHELPERHVPELGSPDRLQRMPRGACQTVTPLFGTSLVYLVPCTAPIPCCEKTTQGYYCPSGATTYYGCPAGYYCPAGSGTYSTCAAGTYAPSRETWLLDIFLRGRLKRRLPKFWQPICLCFDFRLHGVLVLSKWYLPELCGVRKLQGVPCGNQLH